MDDANNLCLHWNVGRFYIGANTCLYSVSSSSSVRGCSRRFFASVMNLSRLIQYVNMVMQYQTFRFKNLNIVDSLRFNINLTLLQPELFSITIRCLCWSRYVMVNKLCFLSILEQSTRIITVLMFALIFVRRVKCVINVKPELVNTSVHLLIDSSYSLFSTIRLCFSCSSWSICEVRLLMIAKEAFSWT